MQKRKPVTMKKVITTKVLNFKIAPDKGGAIEIYQFKSHLITDWDFKVEGF